MGKTIKHKKDNKNLKEDKHKRREALMQMADVASAINILPDKHLYKSRIIISVKCLLGTWNA